MPNPITIIRNANENLKFNPEYKDYEIKYGHLTENTENAKKLTAAFIKEVNQDYPHQIAFYRYPSRTHTSMYNGKKRFTIFAETQNNLQQDYDGLILFVDNSHSLNAFIPLVNQIQNEQSFRHFSITVVSNDPNLMENQGFEQQLNIKPTYYKVELVDCEEVIQVTEALSMQQTIDNERVTQIINEMSILTLDNNDPTLRDVVVNTVRGALGNF